MDAPRKYFVWFDWPYQYCKSDKMSIIKYNILVNKIKKYIRLLKNQIAPTLFILTALYLIWLFCSRHILNQIELALLFFICMKSSNFSIDTQRTYLQKSIWSNNIFLYSRESSKITSIRFLLCIRSCEGHCVSPNSKNPVLFNFQYLNIQMRFMFISYIQVIKGHNNSYYTKYISYNYKSLLIQINITCKKSTGLNSFITFCIRLF